MRPHHVGYLVKSVQQSRESFEFLGYVPVGDVVYDHIRDINILFMENDGYMVELIEPMSPNSVVYNLYKKYKNTPYHICYITDNMESDMERIQENGGIKIDEPCQAVAFNGRKVVFFIFPTIGIIELVESEC